MRFDSMFCIIMQGDLFITIGLSETWQLLLVIVIQMKQVGSTVQQLMCTRAIYSQEWINTLHRPLPGFIPIFRNIFPGLFHNSD